MDLIEFIFKTFWNFLGFFVVITAILIVIGTAWKRYLGSKNISKYGWPPEHCNSVGEFRDDDEDDI